MNDIQLKCACGKVKGIAHNVSPRTGNRIVCHCDDCQSFAKYLGTDGILDENKGTDIFQMSYANVEITEGLEHLRSIKLTPKGLTRWYTNCCKTPVGNTMSGRMPFVGLILTFMDDTDEKDKNLGPIRAHTLIKKDSSAARLNTPVYKVVPQILLKIVMWKFRDSKKKNPFYDESGAPVSEPMVLNKN